MWDQFLNTVHKQNTSTDWIQRSDYWNPTSNPLVQRLQWRNYWGDDYTPFQKSRKILPIMWSIYQNQSGTDTDARIEAVIIAVFRMFKKFSGEMQGILKDSTQTSKGEN